MLVRCQNQDFPPCQDLRDGLVVCCQNQDLRDLWDVRMGRSKDPGWIQADPLRRSRHKLQVELFEQAGQVFAEEVVGAAQAAPLVEGGVLEVAQLHADAARDVVSDGLQPGYLLTG